MNGSEGNEAKGHSVLKKAIFSILIPPTTHFEQILNENIQTLTK